MRNVEILQIDTALRHPNRLRSSRAAQLVGPNQQLLQREASFQKITQPYRKRLSELPSQEKRLSQLELVMLYWLLVKNGVDEIIRKDTPLSLESRTSRAGRYIRKITSQIQNAENNYQGVTFGLENESRDAKNETLQRARALEVALVWNKHLKRRKEFLKEYFPFLGPTKPYYDSWKRIIDQTYTRIDGIKERMAKPLAILGITESQLPRRDNIYIPSGFSVLSKITQRKLEIHGNYIEFHLDPSVSMDYQKRMLYYVGKAAELSNMNLHITIGGISLSPETTEFMHILPIGIAAGLFNDKENAWRERFPKAKKADLRYFPFYYTKDANDLQDYATKAIEVRSSMSFPVTPEAVRKKLRFMRFLTFAAYANKAIQVKPDERTPQQKRYIDAWQNVMKSWEDLLQTNGLEFPRNKSGGMFINVDSPTDEDFVDDNVLEKEKYQGKTAFEHLLNDVETVSNTDNFKLQSKLIILNFCHEMDQLTKSTKQQELQQAA